MLSHSAEVAADDDAGAVSRKQLHVSRIRIEAAVAIHQVLLDVGDVQDGNAQMALDRVLTDRSQCFVSGHISDDGHDPVGEMHLPNELKRVFISEIAALAAGTIRLVDELTERRTRS